MHAFHARRCLYPARWGSVDVKRLGRRGRGAITDPEAVKTVLDMKYYTLPNLCDRLMRCVHVQSENPVKNDLRAQSGSLTLRNKNSLDHNIQLFFSVVAIKNGLKIK